MAAPDSNAAGQARTTERLLAGYLVLQRKRADCGIASSVIAALCGQNAKRQSEQESGGDSDYAFGHHGGPLGFSGSRHMDGSFFKGRLW
jgi:hypothetical protein